MSDVSEILSHWWAGRSLSEISTSLGVDRKTIRKYVAPAIEAGIVPGEGAARTREQWRGLVAEWWPELVDARLRQVTWPEIEKHRDYIAGQLAAGVTQATIHQRLRDERGLSASVASLKRWVAANLPEEVKRRAVTVLGEAAVPGEQAQIDYGLLGTWTDPKTGKRHRVWAFVMVLVCSRLMFVRPVLRMDQQAWTRAHVEAFGFFGGVPARLVPDNLKTGVERPDLYDPLINRSYAELAEHYGTLVDPARAAKPKDKPQVERPMPYVRDSFWRGREFISLEQMQAAALTWCREVAGKRHCRPLGGAAPGSVFAAVEAEALRPLPARPFVLATWSRAKVGPDIHIKAGKTLYSVPWRHIGHTVEVRSTASIVQVFDAGELIATHPYQPRGKQTEQAHYPPEKIAFRMKTPTWCRNRAAEIGPGCVAVVGELLAVNALYRLRAAQGVVGLAAKHGPDRVEKACARAVAVGDPSYRTVKGILTARTEDAPLDWHDGPAEKSTDASGSSGAGRVADLPAYLHGPDTLFGELGNVVALSAAGGARRGQDPGELPARRGPADHEPAAQPGPGDHEPAAHPGPGDDEPAARPGPGDDEPSHPASQPGSSWATRGEAS